jgi:hypothetical protein
MNGRIVAALVLALLMPMAAFADERNALQLQAFIIDATEYLSEHKHISAEEAQPHFGKLRKREWVTERVDTPHARFQVNSTRLPGWGVSLEYDVHIELKPPRSVHITVGEFEQSLGKVEPDDPESIPTKFLITGLGPSKICSTTIIADGKSGPDDWRRQHIRSLLLVC